MQQGQGTSTAEDLSGLAPARGQRTSVAPFLAATLLTQIAVAWALSSMPAIAPHVARELGLPVAAIGYQVGLAYGGGMVTSLLGGALVRRWGAVRTSQACLCLCMLGCLLFTIPSLIALAFASVVVGLSYGLANPAASHLLARFSRSSSFHLIFSVKQTGIPLGAMLAGIAAPYLALSLGWRSVFVVVALAALTLALALQPPRHQWDVDRNPTTRVNSKPFDGLRLVWVTPALRRLSLTALCFSVVQLCAGSFLVAFLVEEVRFSLIHAGMMLALLQVSGVVGRLVWGWIADRLHNGRATLAAMALLMTAGTVLAGTVSKASPLGLTYLLVACLGFCAIGWPGVYLAEVVRHSPPGQSGAATGGSLFFTYAGILFGAPMFAYVYGLLGTYAATYQLLAVASLTGLFWVGSTLHGQVEAPRAPREDPGRV